MEKSAFLSRSHQLYLNSIPHYHYFSPSHTNIYKYYTYVYIQMYIYLSINISIYLEGNCELQIDQIVDNASPDTAII